MPRPSRRLADLTPEEQERARTEARRAYLARTDAQREAYRAAHAEWSRRAYASLTAEEKAARAARQKERRSSMTPEQKQRQAEYMRQWRAKNPDKVAAYGVGQAARNRAWRERKKATDPDGLRRRNRASLIKTKFGLTLDQFDALVLAQGGLCAICKRPETAQQRGILLPLSIDHDRRCCPGDRSCGQCIRGLLCLRCNRMLGEAQDSIETMRAGIAYLESRAA